MEAVSLCLTGAKRRYNGSAKSSIQGGGPLDEGGPPPEINYALKVPFFSSSSILKAKADITEMPVGSTRSSILNLGEW